MNSLINSHTHNNKDVYPVEYTYATCFGLEIEHPTLFSAIANQRQILYKINNKTQVAKRSIKFVASTTSQITAQSPLPLYNNVYQTSNHQIVLLRMNLIFNNLHNKIFGKVFQSRQFGWLAFTSHTNRVFSCFYEKCRIISETISWNWHNWRTSEYLVSILNGKCLSFFFSLVILDTETDHLCKSRQSIEGFICCADYNLTIWISYEIVTPSISTLCFLFVWYTNNAMARPPIPLEI